MTSAHAMTALGLVLREDVRPGDEASVMAVAASSGFFSHKETVMAGDLVQGRLRDGEQCGYHFVFAERDSARGGGASLAGFACYGPATTGPDQVDLYWIAVHAARRGEGIGSLLLGVVEERIRPPWPVQLVAETSSRKQYAPTRAFYEHKNFTLTSETKDFYGLGEHKMVYAKRLAPPALAGCEVRGEDQQARN